jgi:predicted unusual protein kinase regulating ubiquinone biosynthesis (AarF/ABC1/UbiB family)
MKIAPTHLRRYKDVAVLFAKYANKNVVQQAGFTLEESDPGTAVAEDATGLADDLEKLGPTFVKIGQLLSTRGDLLPPVYLEALSRLQDDVSPVPYDEIEKALQDELGVRISKGFESFEREPLAAASLGQVHQAVLRGGRPVAVKVQRPGIRQTVVDDIDSLAAIAEFLDGHTEFGKTYQTKEIVEQFRRSVLRELDYQMEANQLGELRHNLAEFDRLKVPAVIEDYTTSKILTMDYFPGTKITALSGVVLTDLDGDVLAEELFRAYLKQILVDGFFHADPHPGNLLLTHDRNIAILDLGMVGRVPERTRDQLLHLLAGIGDGNGAQVAEAAMSIAAPREGAIDRVGFVSAVEKLVGVSKAQSLAKIEVGTVVLQVTKVCADAGLRKTLLNLDRVGAALSPGFDPPEAIRRHLADISKSRVKDTFALSNLMGLLTEAKQFVGQFPSRMNRLLDLLADNKLRVKVDSIDEKALIVGLQKVANRITLGLILAALIVGSSMLARIPTHFQIFGYPGLAMVFFLLAALGSLVLFIQIVFKDR